jgi:DNA polymerase III delta subunit
VRSGPATSPFRSWVTGTPAPAYVLGEEGARLAEMLAEELVSRFRKEGETSEFVHWSVADLERESPAAAWRSPSFFARWRVFLLPDAGDWKQGPRKEILAYLESPDPSVLLVIPCSDRKSRTLFTSVRGIRSASPGEEDVVTAMAGYAVSRAAEDGMDLSEEAAVFLARWVGSDYSRFRAEMGKLLSFAASRREIGEEEIREICVAGGSVDPFRLADDLMVRNIQGCISKFRRFAADAETGDYHALVGAIAWSVRRRLAGGTPRGKGMGMRRGGETSPFTAARGEEILSALSRIDRGIKGGMGLTPEQVFEIQLLKLLS